MKLIGLDFSINKPAACIYANGEYQFISWPYDLSEKFIKLFRNAGIQIIERTDDKEKGDNISERMRYEVQNSVYLAQLIKESLDQYLDEDTYIGFEGLSYGSSGDVGIQLGGYKYMLMHEFSKVVPLNHMFTYSPITVKSVAGCAKKGMGKADMIEAFIQKGPNTIFNYELKENSANFKNKKGVNWIVHVDDLIDSYWVLETLKVKEKLT